MSPVGPTRDAVYYADDPNWHWPTILTAVGGMIMFIGGVIFFVVVFGTIFSRRVVTERQEIPVTDVEHGAKESWRVLDSIGTWVTIAAVLSVLVYGEVILHYWPINDVSPGIRVW